MLYIYFLAPSSSLRKSFLNFFFLVEFFLWFDRRGGVRGEGGGDPQYRVLTRKYPLFARVRPFWPFRKISAKISGVQPPPPSPSSASAHPPFIYAHQKIAIYRGENSFESDLEHSGQDENSSNSALGH